ncbi:hypothetical protein, partial [Salmonella enterica]|uniref:hypothetical protein n=1 Tax=Salmonella enterica TaxID=28901 RepID=UPI003CF38123
MFELVPVINSLKDKLIAPDAVSADTLRSMQQHFKVYLEDIMGLKEENEQNNESFSKVIELLLSLRKEARTKKD